MENYNPTLSKIKLQYHAHFPGLRHALHEKVSLMGPSWSNDTVMHVFSTQILVLYAYKRLELNVWCQIVQNKVTCQTTITSLPPANSNNTHKRNQTRKCKKYYTEVTPRDMHEKGGVT
jgi:predicted secreted Zn-dependent protease